MGAEAFEREGQLARMVLSNPGARNAMSLPMMADFLAVTDLMADPPVALIVVGGGADGFCAGGDMRDVRLTSWMTAQQRRCHPRWAERRPRRRKSDGHRVGGGGAALGGGAELSRAADWVVMAESARIGFVHARLGVSPGWGGASLLFRRVGRSAAAAILLRGSPRRGECVDARVGRQVTADGEALAQAEAWLAPILTAPPDAIRGALRLVREGDVRSGRARARDLLFTVGW